VFRLDPAAAVVGQRSLNQPGRRPHMYACVRCLQAVSDFMERIAKYEEIYEPITDRIMHYIKLTDM
jgi:6-phosphofructo-2-kinase/fructose-2,6-biphosphatase